MKGGHLVSENLPGLRVGFNSIFVIKDIVLKAFPRMRPETKGIPDVVRRIENDNGSLYEGTMDLFTKAARVDMPFARDKEM